MKKRLFIASGSLIVLIVAALVAWYLASSRFVSDASDEASSFEGSEQTAESVSREGEVQSTVAGGAVEIATITPDEATEETMAVETKTGQDQPNPTEPQATESQPTEPQAGEVEPTETQPAEFQLAAASQPTATQPSEPQPTATPSVEIQATEPQPTQVPTSEREPTEVAPVVIRQGQFKDADSVHQGSGTATIYQRSDGSYQLSFENFAVCCGPDLYVFLANNPSPTGHADLGDYLELSSLKSSTGNQEYEISADTDLSQINSIVIYCKPFQVIISTATLG